MWRRVLEGWHDDITRWVRDGLPRLAVILVTSAVLLWLLRAITRRVTDLSKREQLPTGLRAQQLRTLTSVINSIGVFAIFFFALIGALRTFSIDAAPLLASAGVVGLAIGFGAQTLVKDMINGFFILLENQYDLGDTIRIGGVSGTVEQMTLRKTVLRDVNGALHTVPNSEVKIVSNLTRDWSQVTITAAVDYSESSERIIGLLQDIGTELRNDPNFKDLMVADPEVPGIERVQGPEVDYLMVVKVRPGQQYQVSRELRRRIKESFIRNNVKPGGPSRIFVTESSPLTRSQE